MNPDLILVDEDIEYFCTEYGVAHIWLAQVDQWGREGAVCERCGVQMGIDG